MILPYQGIIPQIEVSVFVAPSADIIGDVEIDEQSSIWFQTVIRGDVNSIKIGKRTNVQDGSVLHVTRAKPPLVSAPLVIGDDVTIGHKVTLHGCTLGNRILVGMCAVVLDHAVVGDDSIIAAGALITKGKTFPPRSLIQGAPAKAVRELTADEISFLKQSALNYVGDSRLYLAEYKELGLDGECHDEDCEDPDCSSEHSGAEHE